MKNSFEDHGLAISVTSAIQDPQGSHAEQGVRTGAGGRNFDLRLECGGPRFPHVRTKRPSLLQENNEEHGKKSDDQFDGGIRRRGRAPARNAGNLRISDLKTIGWWLVGHGASILYSK